MSAPLCNEIELLIPAHLSGELPAAESARVESHLAECAACREAADTLRLLSGAMQAEPLPALLEEPRRARIAETFRRRAERPALKPRWLEFLEFINPARPPAPALRFAVAILVFIVLPVLMMALLLPAKMAAHRDYERLSVNMMELSPAPVAVPERSSSQLDMIEKELDGDKLVALSDEVGRLQDDDKTVHEIAEQVLKGAEAEPPATPALESENVRYEDLAAGPAVTMKNLYAARGAAEKAPADANGRLDAAKHDTLFARSSGIPPTTAPAAAAAPKPVAKSKENTVKDGVATLRDRASVEFEAAKEDGKSQMEHKPSELSGGRMELGLNRSGAGNKREDSGTLPAQPTLAAVMPPAPAKQRTIERPAGQEWDLAQAADAPPAPAEEVAASGRFYDKSEVAAGKDAKAGEALGRKMVPLVTELPKPMFVGTPVPFGNIPNLEKPDGGGFQVGQAPQGEASRELQAAAAKGAGDRLQAETRASRPGVPPQDHANHDFAYTLATDGATRGDLTKTGSGTLTISGGDANAADKYASFTVINGGTLVANSAVAAPADAMRRKAEAASEDAGLPKGWSGKTAHGGSAPASLEGKKPATTPARPPVKTLTPEQIRGLLATGLPQSAARPAAPAPPPAVVAPRDADGPRPSAPREPAGFNPYVTAKENAFSTFSIDVDTASYTLTRQALAEGRLPDPEEVRTEEIVNAFDYDYAPPAAGAFAIHADMAPSPFRTPLELLKIGVQGRLIGRDAKRPAVLTLVIDGSGSMDTADRLGRIRAALRLLAGQLKPQDSIAIVQFSNQSRLLLERTSGTNRAAVLAAVDALSANGSTDLEAGLRLGYEIAARGYRSGAANRVILLSDGVANLSAARADSILATVERYRRQGIYLTVLGFGRGNYDDAMLEQLADKGDGQYAFVDSDAEAKRLLVDQWEQTLHVIARDVKIQVEFNPDRVARWRQLGYENRRLKKEDFRNDAVDAGEVGSGQAVTALYDLELTGDAALPVATVRVRFKDPDTGAVSELEQRVTAADRRRDFSAAPARFRVAACAAEFAELLRVSPYSAGTDWDVLAATLRPAALELSLDQRVQELLRLVDTARGLAD